MKRILVTGAAGQLGLSIQDIHANYPDFVFVFKGSDQLDITDVENVEETIGSGNYDFVINCAAYTNVDQAEKTPEIAFKVNAEAVKNIALACKKHEVVLIHISTDYVFDGEKGEPYTVDDIPNPINAYGKSKLKGEEYVQEILTDYFIVRTSWLYSKKHGKNFHKTILAKAKKKEVLYITDEQIGCPTDAVNLAKHSVEFIFFKSKEYGIQHFTDNEVMTWYGFAQKILEKNGLQNNVRLERAKSYCTFVLRPKNSVLKNSERINKSQEK